MQMRGIKAPETRNAKEDAGDTDTKDPPSALMKSNSKHTYRHTFFGREGGGGRTPSKDLPWREVGRYVVGANPHLILKFEGVEDNFCTTHTNTLLEGSDSHTHIVSHTNAVHYRERKCGKKWF